MVERITNWRDDKDVRQNISSSKYLADLQAQLEEFKPELRIDKTQLDKECELQADMYFRASEIAAEVASLRDAAKHDLQVTEADTAQYLRNSAADLHDRVTDASVKEMTLADREVVAAARHVIALDRLAKEWNAMQAAIDLRGRMLRDLTQLYVSGYFTITSTGGTVNVLREAKAERGRSALRERRNDYPTKPRRE